MLRWATGICTRGAQIWNRSRFQFSVLSFQFSVNRAEGSLLIAEGPCPLNKKPGWANFLHNWVAEITSVVSPVSASAWNAPHALLQRMQRLESVLDGALLLQMISRSLEKTHVGAHYQRFLGFVNPLRHASLVRLERVRPHRVLARMVMQADPGDSRCPRLLLSSAGIRDANSKRGGEMIRILNLRNYFSAHGNVAIETNVAVDPRRSAKPQGPVPCRAEVPAIEAVQLPATAPTRENG